ncbi:MAG: type VI secretion system Vgr family protein, partial [Anaerolineales bacterium]
MAENKRVLSFHSGAVPEDTLLVSRMEGAEEISHPYRFEVELRSRKADFDFAEALRQPAFLGIKKGVKLKGEGGQGTQTLKIHGMLSLFRQEAKAKDWVTYRAVLVPRLWKLSLTVQSRVFLEKDIREIAGEVLKGAGFTTKDYEFKTSGRHPKREFVVQYQESDLAFLSRWLEHEGIFYFFEQTDEGEKLVFGDSPSAHTPIAGDPNVPYRPAASEGTRVQGGEAQDWYKEEVVQSLAAEQSVIPAEVVLKDYNWRKPSEDLKVSAEVIAGGVGSVFNYADHFKDKDEGKALAKVRAEEIRCRQKLFTGAGDCRAFRAGATYTLADHYRTDFNASYLLVRVRHEASQALGFPDSAASGATYRNEFTGIPADVPFRPERATEWPSIHGVMNAKVDAAGSGQYAEIDDQGRYKVKLPFDLSDRKDGKGSRYLRMAQPYSGAGMGMHFPLHKGTEVLLAFVDGDVDRPIIAASIPNAETGGPVSGGNQTQCK